MNPPMPSFYISHGAGPCFFIAKPLGGPGTWDGLRGALERIPSLLPRRPKAILVVSAHWETAGFKVTGGSAPPLVYDYNNYPPEAYAIRYPAKGDPALAGRVVGKLREAGLQAAEDPRGFDHAVFIPMKVMYPDADIPIVAMSLDTGFEPDLHLRAGEALAALRDEDVLVVGSGSSFHNRVADPTVADRFDQWLVDAVADPGRRRDLLAHWDRAPAARVSHAREEHLLPLMLASGAARHEPGQVIFRERVLGASMTCFAFGGLAGEA